MGSKLKDDFEPYWDDEKDWLRTVEFRPVTTKFSIAFQPEML
jgi:hypothetical protein